MAGDAAVALSPRTVPAVARAAGILRALASGRQSATLTDLATAVGIYKSTAHGILRTLTAFDLVERDPATRRYRLGPALVALGQAAQDPGDLGALARPHLVHLARLTAETVALHARDGDETVIVASQESPQRLKVTAPAGFRMPAYAGSVSKVFDAFDAAPRAHPTRLPAFTPRSILAPARWQRELGKVRRVGFAIDDMEFQAGIRAISAPVFADPAARREVVAAYSIVAVASRVSAARLRGWAPALLASAEALSETVHQARRGGGSRGGGPEVP